MDITDLIDMIVKCWPFDAANYPRLAHISGSQHREFAIRHILMHQMKSCGKLAGICEPMEHGLVTIDEAELRLITRKFLVNTLRLAAVVGITRDQLEEDISHWAAEEH